MQHCVGGGDGIVGKGASALHLGAESSGSNLVGVKLYKIKCCFRSVVMSDNNGCENEEVPVLKRQHAVILTRKILEELGEDNVELLLSQFLDQIIEAQD